MTDRSYEDDISLNNPKYQLGYDNAIEILNANNFRTIQLSTIAKLTTDNQSIIKDFPISKNKIGAPPYNRYCIKVSDTENTTLYILVSQHENFVYLCPIVSGFKENNYTDILQFTHSWRTRCFKLVELENSIKEKLPNFLELNSIKQSSNASFTISRDWGNKEVPAIKINTRTGVYNPKPALWLKPENSIWDDWYESEYLSINDARYGVTAPSSAALVIQIWLHTISLWREKCLNRKVIVKNNVTNTVNTLNSIEEYIPNSNYHIVDLSKNVVIYENHIENVRKFNGFHMTETQRCGHFRRLKNGSIIYIKPTTVHFKQILPDAHNGLKKKLIYRNTEDFLREKSYLEYEICEYLKNNKIRYEREKCFSWLGRKRLDFYLPDLNVAIECQGVQHFYKYGAEDTDLVNRQKRDEDKFEECKCNGVKLLYYKHEEIPLPPNMENQELYYSDIEKLFAPILQ